jgi:hypothetical protein
MMRIQILGAIESNGANNSDKLTGWPSPVPLAIKRASGLLMVAIDLSSPVYDQQSNIEVGKQRQRLEVSSWRDPYRLSRFL